MRIAITGSSGFVGHAAVAALRAAGHLVIRLVRTREAGGGRDTAAWDPATGAVDAQALGAVDAVIHLAGENVAGGRWKESRKKAISDSRGPATERLCRSLAGLAHRPRVLVSASAIGIYGPRDELLDESSSLGTDFLAEVAKAWEAATTPAQDAGLRVVQLRIGMVLDPSGGALRRLLLPFRLGVGGRLGDGRQWISWITRHDLVRVLGFALANEGLAGPVLAVSPGPVTNRDFTRALGRALSRPTLLPVPAFALRLLFGEMADALLLGGQRAMPRQLTEHGFAFDHGDLDSALRALLQANG